MLVTTSNTAGLGKGLFPLGSVPINDRGSLSQRSAQRLVSAVEPVVCHYLLMPARCPR